MECPSIPTIPYSEFSEHIHTKTAGERIPVNGSIELTFRCNLNCVHCYCPRGNTEKEMSYEDVCRVLDDIASSGCLWLTLTGGEPLLRDDFKDIYIYAKKKGMIITLFTNATLITPEIASFLKSWPPFAVEVSIYGASKDTYERITAVRGSFERCLKGINLLFEHKIPLRLKTMLMTINKHELFKMKRFAESLGVEFRFDPLLNPTLSGSLEPCSYRIKPQEVVELDLNDKKRKESWQEFCEKFPEPIKTDLLFSCSAGRTSFHIDPYGNLCMCIIVRSPAYDLRKGSFKEGWSDFFFNLLSKKKSSHSECTFCELRDLCSFCPGAALLEKKDPDAKIEYFCEIAHLRAKVFNFGRYKKAVSKKEVVNYDK